MELITGHDSFIPPPFPILHSYSCYHLALHNPYSLKSVDNQLKSQSFWQFISCLLVNSQVCFTLNTISELHRTINMYSTETYLYNFSIIRQTCINIAQSERKLHGKLQVYHTIRLLQVIHRIDSEARNWMENILTFLYKTIRMKRK